MQFYATFHYFRLHSHQNAQKPETSRRTAFLSDSWERQSSTGAPWNKLLTLALLTTQGTDLSHPPQRFSTDSFLPCILWMLWCYKEGVCHSAASPGLLFWGSEPPHPVVIPPTKTNWIKLRSGGVRAELQGLLILTSSIKETTGSAQQWERKEGEAMRRTGLLGRGEQRDEM